MATSSGQLTSIHPLHLRMIKQKIIVSVVLGDSLLLILLMSVCLPVVLLVSPLNFALI